MSDSAGEKGPDRENPAGPAPHDPQQSEQPEYADRVHRSVPGVISGVLLLAVAAWLIIDAMMYGAGRTPWAALAAGFFFVPLIIAYTVRPVVQVGRDRLVVRNPLRTIVAPWAAVETLRSAYSVELLAGGRKYQVWAIPVSLRQRKRATRMAARAAAEDPYEGRGDRTAGRPGLGRSAVPGAPDPTRAWSDQVVDTLRETAERNASRPEAAGEVTTAWCWWIIAPAVAGLVGLVVLIATA